MSDEQLINVILSGGGVAISGILSLWIRTQISRLDKVDDLVGEVENLKKATTEAFSRMETNMDKFSGELKGITQMMYQNQKDIAVMESSAKAQWKRYEEMAREVRSIKA